MDITGHKFSNCYPRTDQVVLGNSMPVLSTFETLNLTSVVIMVWSLTKTPKGNCKTHVHDTFVDSIYIQYLGSKYFAKSVDYGSSYISNTQSRKERRSFTTTIQCYLLIMTSSVKYSAIRILVLSFWLSSKSYRIPTKVETSRTGCNLFSCMGPKRRKI